MGYSGAGGKLIHEKAESKKSCDTVPLKLTEKLSPLDPIPDLTAMKLKGIVNKLF
jgi:hypothetical protein